MRSFAAATLLLAFSQLAHGVEPRGIYSQQCRRDVMCTVVVEASKGGGFDLLWEAETKDGRSLCSARVKLTMGTTWKDRVKVSDILNGRTRSGVIVTWAEFDDDRTMLYASKSLCGDEVSGIGLYERHWFEP